MKREPAEPQGFIKLTGVGIPRLQAGEDVNIFPFGLHIVRRVDQEHGGFTAHTPFGMAFPVFRMRIIGVQPVEQFMGERASFLHVGHMLVDDYGLDSLTVEA